MKTRSKTVKLGLMPPLSGIVKIYGTEISRAAQIACRDVNNEGGVLGRPLELIIEDDGSFPQTAIIAAKKLVEHHQCCALIGNLLSNSRIAVAYQVAEPKKIPYLNFSFYEGSILSRYFFHFAALPNQQIELMIPYMKNKFGPRMFFAGNSYEWPRGSIDAAKKSLLKVGGEIVGEEYSPIGCTTSDLEAVLTKLESSKADVFVPFFAGTDQINLLNLFTQKGLKNKFAVVMGHYDEVMSSMLSAEVREGFYSSNTYFMNVETKENEKFKAQLLNWPGITGLWPNGRGILTNFGEGAYLCVKAFAKAANKAKSLDSDALIQELEVVELVSPQGLVRMDAATHHAKVNTFLTQCQYNGEFKIIEKFGAIAPVIPERYQYLHMKTPDRIDDMRIQSRILAQMAEAVFLINPTNGEILYVNAGAERMFKYNYNEFVKKNIADLNAGGEELSLGINSKIDQILYQKGVWNGELKNIKKDGTVFWTSVTISAFTHAIHGEVWMAVYKDITEQKKQTEFLKRATEEIEKANRAKSLFLASISHEIRTPMNVILGIAELLSDTQLTQEQKKYVEIFKKSGTSLLALINDILDISKIERDEFELAEAPFSLVKEIENCIDIFAVKAHEKNLSLSYEIKTDNLPLFIGDAGRIRQILTNLVGNGLKFTEKGRVLIQVESGVAHDGKMPVAIKVQDTGVGISLENQKHIFNPFTQADMAITRRFGGTGLGLSISKKLIEKMGGTIRVESELGKGSTFTIQMNFKMAKNFNKNFISDVSDSIGKPNNVVSDSSMSGSVLLVDDNEDNRLLVTSFLKKLPIKIETAENGQIAIEKYKKGHFDAILMDIYMPVMDGYSAMHEIRLLEKSKNSKPAPIIALTAQAMKEDRDKCLKAGADDYLAKPINKESLLGMLNKYLREKNALA